MFPALFRIPLPEFLGGGSFPIRMFGVMVILGFLAGTWVFARRLRKVGLLREGGGAELSKGTGRLTSEDAFDFCFYLLAVGILGSRLTYVFQNFGQFEGRGHEILYIWQGGLVWYGGFALSTLFAFWWLWRKKAPVLPIVDAAALAVTVGLAIGRWGCFCAGDDYGKLVHDAEGQVVQEPEKAPWYALRFPRGGPRVPEEEMIDWRYQYSETPVAFQTPYYVHPVQLYMSFKNLVVLGALLVIASRTRRHGMLAASYLVLYPVARFVVEFWRGDVDRDDDFLGSGLSFSQFFGILPSLAGIGLFRYVLRRPPEPPAPSTQ
jgi:phosphatidylglycerol:prolipoprotein diacylglycerol transferase